MPLSFHADTNRTEGRLSIAELFGIIQSRDRGGRWTATSKIGESSWIGREREIFPLFRGGTSEKLVEDVVVPLGLGLVD